MLGKSLYSVGSFLHPGIWLNTSEVLRKLIGAGEGGEEGEGMMD